MPVLIAAGAGFYELWLVEAFFLCFGQQIRLITGANPGNEAMVQGRASCVDDSCMPADLLKVSLPAL